MPSINYLLKTAYTGGDYVNMCHVTSLRSLGWNARAIHLPNRKRRARHRFLTPLIKPGNASDIFVISEGDTDLYEELGGRRRIIQHNQAPYYTFGTWPDAEAINRAPIEAILTPSVHAAELLRALNINKTLHVVRPYLSPEFHGTQQKQLAIAFNPNKRANDSRFIQAAFKEKYPAFRDIPWRPLTGMPRAEVARALQQSAIYASFAELESLGLLGLEAMQSGCIVVGYKGQGGNEYATNENGFWVADGDVHQFMETLAEVCSQIHNPSAMNSIRSNAKLTASQFNQARFESELQQAWVTILGQQATQFKL